MKNDNIEPTKNLRSYAWAMIIGGGFCMLTPLIIVGAFVAIGGILVLAFSPPLQQVEIEMVDELAENPSTFRAIQILVRTLFTGLIILIVLLVFVYGLLLMYSGL